MTYFRLRSRPSTKGTTLLYLQFASGIFSEKWDRIGDSTYFADNVGTLPLIHGIRATQLSRPELGLFCVWRGWVRDQRTSPQQYQVCEQSVYEVMANMSRVSLVKTFERFRHKIEAVIAADCSFIVSLCCTCKGVYFLCLMFHVNIVIYLVLCR